MTNIDLMKYKRQLILTSIVILLPVLAGLVLWNQLPEMIATHFNSAYEPDGWSSRPIAVFGMPFLMLALHWFVLIIVRTDPRRQNISPKMFRIVLWIIPVISLFTAVLTYSQALAEPLKMALLSRVFLGFLFIILGNLLPKCRQSYTVGIRLPWTLADSENWDHTHRFGGFVWVAGGLLLLLMAFLPIAGRDQLEVAVILCLVGAPALYSFLYYIRNDKKGENDE